MTGSCFSPCRKAAAGGDAARAAGLGDGRVRAPRGARLEPQVLLLPPPHLRPDRRHAARQGQNQ